MDRNVYSSHLALVCDGNFSLSACIVCDFCLFSMHVLKILDVDLYPLTIEVITYWKSDQKHLLSYLNSYDVNHLFVT